MMIDSIIITGILILLTISEPELRSTVDMALILYTKIIILITLLPFSISAIIEIKGALNGEENIASKKGLKATRYGFTYLIILFVLIIVGQISPILKDILLP